MVDNTSRIGLYIEVKCPYCTDQHIIKIFHNDDLFRCPKAKEVFGITPELIDSVDIPSSKKVANPLLPINTELQEEPSPRKKAQPSNSGQSNDSSHPKKSSKTKVINKNNNSSSVIPTSESFGRYQILKTLGGGGFGLVYKAFDPKLQRNVAIKRSISPLEEGESIENFTREAQILAKLNHPNIIQIYDFDLTEDRIPYIVVEFVEGQNICDYLKELKLQDQNNFLLTAGKFFSELAEALAFLHGRDIFHQDLKPANILISKKSGAVKLLDFGLAIIGSAELTHFEGTCRYCAPERFANGYKPTAESDIYSYGIVLYKALTSREPVPGERIHEYINHIVTGQLKTAFHPREVHEALQKICLKCVKLKPEDRYHSATDLHLDLECYVTEITQNNDYPYLYLLEQNKTRVVFPLMKKRYFIGRSFGNDLIIQSNTISRVQALIDNTGDEMVLTNLSKNVPVYVNNKPLPYKSTSNLTQMDCIEISHHILFFINNQKIQVSLEQTPNEIFMKTYLPIDRAQLILFAEEEEIEAMIEEGKIQAFKRGQEVLIDAQSVLSHIEKSSGSKVDPIQKKKVSTFPSGLILKLYDYDELLQTCEFDDSYNSITIGRHPDCDLIIYEGTGISRRHCQIEKQESGNYTLFDLNSNNGTFINSNKIQKHPLKSGDMIFLGKSYRILSESLCEAQNPEEEQEKSFVDLQIKDGEITLPTENNDSRQTNRLLRQETQKMMSFLLFTEQNRQKKVFLGDENVFFGTDPTCQFRIIEASLSPKQALIFKNHQGYNFVNLTSEQHVLLNKKQVDQSILEDGDSISIGSYKYQFFQGPSLR